MESLRSRKKKAGAETPAKTKENSMAIVSTLKKDLIPGENLSQNSRYHLEEIYYHLLYVRDSFEEFSYHLKKYNLHLSELSKSVVQDRNNGK